MGVKLHLLLSLSGRSKQAGDEYSLPHDVPFFDTMHLAFRQRIRREARRPLNNVLKWYIVLL
jgi:hypothetical protein